MIVLQIRGAEGPILTSNRDMEALRVPDAPTIALRWPCDCLAWRGGERGSAIALRWPTERRSALLCGGLAIALRCEGDMAPLLEKALCGGPAVAYGEALLLRCGGLGIALRCGGNLHLGSADPRLISWTTLWSPGQLSGAWEAWASMPHSQDRAHRWLH